MARRGLHRSIPAPQVGPCLKPINNRGTLRPAHFPGIPSCHLLHSLSALPPFCLLSFGFGPGALPSRPRAGRLQLPPSCLPGRRWHCCPGPGGTASSLLACPGALPTQPRPTGASSCLPGRRAPSATSRINRSERRGARGSAGYLQDAYILKSPHTGNTTRATIASVYRMVVEVLTEVSTQGLRTEGKFTCDTPRPEPATPHPRFCVWRACVS